MKRLGRIQLLTIALLSAITLLAPLALAQTTGQPDQPQRGPGREWGGRRGGHDGPGGPMLGMMRGLNLTEDQKTRMKQLHESFRDRTQALRQELRTKQQELGQASEGGSFNEALATQKLTEMAGLQAKLMGEEFKLRQETLALLTPEQKTQLEQRREQFKSRWAEREGRQVQ